MNMDLDLISMMVFGIMLIILVIHNVLKRHRWKYTDRQHRQCKRCGQKQMLYTSILICNEGDSAWVSDGYGFTTDNCPSTKEQAEMNAILEKYRLHK